MIRAHQPGSEPIDIPETIPNPVVVPKPTPTPTEPAPKEPVRWLAQKETRDYDRQQRLLEVAGFYRSLAGIIPAMPTQYKIMNDVVFAAAGQDARREPEHLSLYD